MPEFEAPVPPPPRPSIAGASSSSIHWRHALPAALRAGLIAGAIMVLPVVGFGLGMLAAGVLGVVFYRRRTYGAHPTLWAGSRLGAVSGLFGFSIFSILVATLLLSSSTRAQFRQAAFDAIQRAAARSPDIQSQQVIEFFKTSEGLALVFAAGAVFLLVLYVTLSGLSGLITAAIVRRGEAYSTPRLPGNNVPGLPGEDTKPSEHEFRPK